MRRAVFTLDEFLNNATDAWRFSVDVAWDQNRRHTELSRGTCMRERSFLRTLLGTDQAEVFGKACSLADAAQSPHEMQVLLPEILAWMEKRYPPPDDPGYEPGRSFRFNLLPDNECYLHIRNARTPESFLNDPAHVAENLRYVMDRAEKEHGCHTIYTVSWLVSLPAFSRYFPDEWQANICQTPAGDFGPTMGWQGQFINRKGLLNRAVASRFLQTGVLPYARMESRCSFAALRDHLQLTCAVL